MSVPWWGPLPAEISFVLVESREGLGGKRDHKYRVELDGKTIGFVVGRYVLSYTTYPGTRIRRDLGYPKRWFAIGADGYTRVSRVGYDTRRRATWRLLEEYEKEEER